MANGTQRLYLSENEKIDAAKAKKLKKQKEAEYLAELEARKKALTASDESN